MTNINAAAYLRMSSDQQDMSIEQQRKEVRELAVRCGFTIVKEYVDSGKSGSLEIEKRTDFLRMIADSKRKEWEVILCWDVQRFGRLDPLKAASYKDALRTNGVHLHTCKEGVIKWDKFTDHVVDAVYAAAAHQYSVSLSQDTIRGRLDLLSQGEWPNGMVPYGYDRLYVNPDGKEYQVRRSENFKKGRNWKRRLVINEEEAKVVRWIFHEYCQNDLSMREIAKRISAPRPDGKSLPWTKDTVKATLTNKIYAGYAHIGGLRNRLRAKEAHNRVGYHEYAGAVPAIVTLEEFEIAVKKIAKNREESRKVQPSTSSPLTGILKCGHCGYRLDKHSRSDRKGHRYDYFSCSSAIKRPALGCRQWRIREDYIFPIVVDWLIKEVDRTVLEQAQTRPEDRRQAPSELEHLRAKMAELDKRIDKGNENYLTAPPHLKAGLEAKLTEWQAERDETERRQRNLALTDGEVSDFARWWQEVKGELVTALPIQWETRKQTLVGSQVRVQKLSPEEASALPVSGYEVIDGEECPFQVGDYPVKPAVMVETYRFRQILRDIGFTVTVYWRPDGPRFWALDYLVLNAKGGEPVKHAVDGVNNKCSRAHTRDKG